MIRVCGWLVGLLSAAHACAAWEFSAPYDVTPEPSANTFHHLDATGRRNIAVNLDTVAVAWEDNHTGRADAYIAFRRRTDAAFSTPLRLNADAEAYAPGVAAAGTGFLAGWTEAGAVWVRHVDTKAAGQSVRLSTRNADQLALASLDEHSAIAVWTETRQDGTCIQTARLEIEGNTVTAGRAQPVSDCASQRFQTQPAVVMGTKGVLVAWQDRSAGSNRVYASLAKDARHFSAPVQISATIQKSANYGAGSSAINPVVAASAQAYWIAWLDKRADRAGYKIYSAHSADGLAWSENLKVQDSFGDEAPQWSVAMTVTAAGTAVAAWSDAREGNGQDIFCSMFGDGAWSDNVLIEHAAAALDQDSPSLIGDANGGIHLVWRHQSADGSARIRYSAGRYSADD